MMNEFGCMEDWDLQALEDWLHGGSCSSEAFADITMENSPSLIAPPLTLDGHHHHHHHQDELLDNFPPADDNFFEYKAPYFDDGLEALYKPFYPPQSMLITSSTTSTPTSISAPQEGKEPEKESKKQPPFDPKESSSSSPKSCTTGDANTSQTTKSKRRRNQNKSVVHVAADGLSNDMWAWRKYGQKPIKGSPYPRSYYRCSSLKGCPARKQVERSSSDPSIFIVAYTAEHSHAYPTRRSALAGSTRTKSSLAKQPSAAAKGPKVATIKDTVRSLKNPSMASLEDEVLQHVSSGTDQEVEQILENNTSGSTKNVMPDLIFPDELFPSFEDFQGLLFY